MEPTSAVATKPTRRLTPQDWIAVAIDALLEDGPAGLRVACLAKRLGVSQGSFYWHFRGREQFRDQILRHWRDNMLRSAAAAAEASGEGAAKLRALPQILAARRLPEFDQAMRCWAAEDSVLADAVAEADELRIRVVATLLEAAGVESERAQVRAKAMMWAFRGAGDAEMGERICVLGDLFEDSIPG
jgi:AcrR family transcriptional regulator